MGSRCGSVLIQTPAFSTTQFPSQVRLLDCRSTWQHKTNVVVGFSSAGILQFQTYAKRNTKACGSLQCIEVWSSHSAEYEGSVVQSTHGDDGWRGYAVLCLHSRDDEGHLKFICYGTLSVSLQHVALASLCPPGNALPLVRLLLAQGPCDRWMEI